MQCIITSIRLSSLSVQGSTFKTTPSQSHGQTTLICATVSLPIQIRTAAHSASKLSASSHSIMWQQCLWPIQNSWQDMCISLAINVHSKETAVSSSTVSIVRTKVQWSWRPLVPWIPNLYQRAGLTRTLLQSRRSHCRPASRTSGHFAAMEILSMMNSAVRSPYCRSASGSHARIDLLFHLLVSLQADSDQAFKAAPFSLSHLKQICNRR